MGHINELQKFLLKRLDWNRARIACLSQILQALICVRTVNLVQISALFQSNTQQDSSYRRVKRFFSGFSFDISAIIPIALEIFALKKGLILILDRTNWKWGQKHINILLLSVAYKGIGIPVFWSVSATGGSSSKEQRVAILKRVLKTIGPKHVHAFLADREFIGEEWFRFLKRAKIPFVIRIKKNTLAGGLRHFHQVPILELWKRRKRTGSVDNHPVLIWGHLLYASVRWAKGSKEPIIVVSNVELENPVGLYQRRWEIETLFGCLKSRGFHLEDTHMTKPERIEKLLFVLAVAFCWSYKVGIIKARIKPVPKKAHGRPSKSLFRVGLDWLRAIFLHIERKSSDFKRVIKIITYSKSLGCEVI